MELKTYQENVLNDLDCYINNILDTGNPAKAYDKLWKDKGARIGGVDGLQQYKDSIPGVPTVCFKVPTGGGKTILGCAALKHIFNAMSTSKKVVVWLVPWETILTQTYNSFMNPRHFYRERLNRDFSSKVEIYNKQQLLNGANFNPSVVSEQLSILVLSFDSLRARKKEDRKVYEENSNLMPFVDSFVDRRDMIENIDDSSLMQVLNRLRPVVIVDESHNAQTDLSKEMIKNLNPSFVLELTATPKNDSNIISIVSASQLKEANMVKLPVISYNRPSVERVIVEAIDLRNSLEKAAVNEKNKNNTPYIRPIVLFQAQPKNEEDSVTFEKLRESLKDIGIPGNQIAIKTANINELSNVNLMSEDCEIRYIITINALKEGWDCPFAYILASLANRTSKIDVEQILGRILRQPHQRRFDSKILNMSYVITSSSDFSSTLDDILAGLNSSGFTKNDVRVARTNSLDNLNEEKKSTENKELEQGNLFEGIESEANDIDSSVFNTNTVKEELLQNAINEGDETLDDGNASFSGNHNVNSMLTQAEEKSDEYEAAIEQSEKEGTSNIPEEIRKFTNIFEVKKEHINEIRNDLKLPVFCFKKEGTLFSDENAIYEVDAEYLNDGFNLSSVPIPTNLTSSSDDIYKVDVETTYEGDVLKKSILTRNDSEEFKKQLNLIPEAARLNACRLRLIYDLNGKFNNISQNEITCYIERILSSLKSEDEIVSLQNNIFAISQRIKNFISEELAEYRYKNFKNKLISNEIFVDYRYQFKSSITCQVHTNAYVKTLYLEEDNKVNSLEEKFMSKVSSLDSVKWWHRNIERIGYAINGYINHYPDFIVETKSGVIIFVETKGEHLDGDDSKKKLELGQLLCSNSNPSKFKYFMAFERSPLTDNGSDLLDNIIGLIEKL